MVTINSNWEFHNNSGWICPRCGRVYAPFIQECTECNKDKGPVDEYDLYMEDD